MIQDFHYPIQTLHTKQLLDKHQLANCKIRVENQLDKYILHCNKQFAVGSQVRTHQNYKVKTTHEALIPKTAKDWVKKLVIEFCPQLNFGWLKPEYKQITKQQKITENVTYYNIYPVPERWDNRPEYIIKWLESEPFTNAEWVTATTRVKSIKRYSGAELANYMAEYLYNKEDFNNGHY